MGLLATALITESSVVTASVLGAVGYVISRAIRRGDARTQTDTSHDVRIQLLERDVTELKRAQEGSARHRQAMSEELSTVAAILDRHEAWHSRHDAPTPPQRGP